MAGGSDPGAAGGRLPNAARKPAASSAAVTCCHGAAGVSAARSATGMGVAAQGSLEPGLAGAASSPLSEGAGMVIGGGIEKRGPSRIAAAPSLGTGMPGKSDSMKRTCGVVVTLPENGS